MNPPTDVATGPLVVRRTIVLFVFIFLAAAGFSFTKLRSAHCSVPVAQPRFGIDPNTATWFELATLPRVGRATADDIIKFREARAKSLDPRQPVFRAPADLDAVPGIGPKTVTRFAPHLRFPPDDDASTVAAD